MHPAQKQLKATNGTLAELFIKAHLGTSFSIITLEVSWMAGEIKRSTNKSQRGGSSRQKYYFPLCLERESYYRRFTTIYGRRSDERTKKLSDNRSRQQQKEGENLLQTIDSGRLTSLQQPSLVFSIAIGRLELELLLGWKFGLATELLHQATLIC